MGRSHPGRGGKQSIQITVVKRMTERTAKLGLQINIYRVIRYGLLLCLFVVVIVLLSRNRESKVPFETVSAAVAESIHTDNAMPGSDRFLKKYFGLNPDDYDGVMIYTPTTNMHANEVLLIRLKDTRQADPVSAAIQERIESQRGIFQGYAPEEIGLLDNAVLDVQGNYILYIVDDNAAAVDEVFRSSL